jgi:hypothetical protein
MTQLAIAAAALTLFLAQARAVETKPAEISFTGIRAELKMLLSPSPINQTPDTDYFAGVTDCRERSQLPRGTRCMRFHTHFSQDEWVQVPVTPITGFQRKALHENLTQINPADPANPIRYVLNSRRMYEWGTAYSYMSLSYGSSHYVFLVPKHKDIAVRIGPVAGTVIAGYDLNLKSLQWAFR